MKSKEIIEGICLNFALDFHFDWTSFLERCRSVTKFRNAWWWRLRGRSTSRVDIEFRVPSKSIVVVVAFRRRGRWIGFQTLENTMLRLGIRKKSFSFARLAKKKIKIIAIINMSKLWKLPLFFVHSVRPDSLLVKDQTVWAACWTTLETKAVVKGPWRSFFAYWEDEAVEELTKIRHQKTKRESDWVEWINEG